jgi:lipoprotein-anchoring transpeptidase ErfK/SrfK
MGRATASGAAHRLHGAASATSTATATADAATPARLTLDTWALQAARGRFSLYACRVTSRFAKHVLAPSIVLAAIVALSAPAFADDAPSGATGPATTAAKKKRTVTPNASTRLGLSVAGTYRHRGKGYVLRGALVKAKGSLDGDYDGLEVEVVIKRGKREVLRKTVRLNAARGKSTFALNYRIRRAGYHRFSAKVESDDPAAPLDARSEYVSVVSSSIKRGAKGVAVRVIQSKLARLKYVVSGDGVFDDALGRALLAFRKVNRMSRVQKAGPAVGRLLARNKGSFRGRYRKAGRHIEVSISRQVMAFYEGKNKLTRIYHVSTGASGTPTIRGRYHFYMKTPGTNAKGMVHSSYFIRGYAIHGFASVPTYPASHGCVRVPIPNAQSIYDWVRIGDRIDTYY